jgi:hypothetical protein
MVTDYLINVFKTNLDRKSNILNILSGYHYSSALTGIRCSLFHFYWSEFPNLENGVVLT